MKSRFLIAVVAFLGYAIIDGQAANATDYFNPSGATANWDASVWDDNCDGVGTSASPGCSADPVVICSGKVAVVDDTNNCAELVTVESSARIDIDPENGAAKLTLGDGTLDRESTLVGDIKLLCDSGGETIATLAFHADKNHSFKRTTATTGDIVGRCDAAEMVAPSLRTIKIYDDLSGTNYARVTGHLTIKGAGKFQNEGAVIADTADGVLKMAATTMDDISGSGRWKVTTSSSAELHFSVEPAALDGDFDVSNGILQAGCGASDDIDVDSQGCLTHTGGKIRACEDDSFSFCPSVR